MKKLLGFMVVLVLLNCSHADVDDSFRSDMFYDGDVILTLDRTSYNPGEEVTASITAANFEDFPIVDASIIVEIVKGDAEHVYPAHESDADNVVFEQLANTITLAPKSQKVVSFKYMIPADAKAGNYRFEVFLVNERTPIVGIPSIFAAPRYKSFTVAGTGTSPVAEIVRTKTTIAGKPGQIGPTLSPGSEVTGEIVIKSASPSGLSDLKIKLRVCEWEDSICSGSQILVEKDFPVGLIDASGETTVPASFTAPNAPEAYAIRLELVDSNDRLLSLYRSRIVVAGETARVRKLAIDKLVYEKGDLGTISVLVSGSPDQNPSRVSKDVKLTVSIAQGGLTTYSESYKIPELSLANGLAVKEFKFNAENDLSGFTVCAKLESSTGQYFDQYCYISDAEKAKTGKIVLSIQTSYAGETLTAELCANDASGARASMNPYAVLYSSDGKKRLESKGEIGIAPCGTLSFNLAKGDYLLMVNDPETGKQYSLPISTEIRTVCGDGKCQNKENRENCCNDCTCGPELVCQDNVCVMPEATTTTTTKPLTKRTTTTAAQTTDTTPAKVTSSGNMILGGAFVVVVAGIAYFATRKKKKGGTSK